MKIIIFLFIIIMLTLYLLNKNKYNEIQQDKKETFPELFGKDVDSAVKYINNNYPNLTPVPIKNGHPRILNYDINRVWLDYDINNKITTIPKIG